jgi:hypothetical protein
LSRYEGWKREINVRTENGEEMVDELDPQKGSTNKDVTFNKDPLKLASYMAYDDGLHRG